MRRRFSRASVLSALQVGAFAALVGCASRPPDRPFNARGAHQPPPKPGSSITHTRMCTCRSCEPRGCCSGDPEPERGSECTDSYDFSRAGCGIAVQSCASRCFEHVWRIQLSESCEATLPEQCCAGG